MIGRYNDADIQRDLFLSSHARNAMRLDDAQQLHLKFLRDRRDVVEEYRTVVGQFKPSGISLTEKDVKGFYYDGAVLGLFYGDNREFDLEEDKVLPFMIKNRLEEEFLTSQSKEEKERNAEKKEERKVKTTESEI